MLVDSSQEVTSTDDAFDRILTAQPDSITTYDCLYRGRGRTLTRGTPELPDPGQIGALYDLAWKKLRAEGYHAPYGSVNFSRHPAETGTSAYFEGRLLHALPYLGIGNYATSLFGDRWTWAERNVRRWIDRAGRSWAIRDDYSLPPEELMAKQLLLMLSFGRISGLHFRERFGEPPESRFGPALERARSEGLLEPRGEDWWMIPGSFGRLPLLRALLYSERALRWLERSTRGSRSSSEVPPRRERPEAPEPLLRYDLR